MGGRALGGQGVFRRALGRESRWNHAQITFGCVRGWSGYFRCQFLQHGRHEGVRETQHEVDKRSQTIPSSRTRRYSGERVKGF